MQSTHEKYDYCKHCGKYLPLVDFAKDSSKKRGYSYHCKECAKLKSKKFRNKENAHEYYQKVKNTPKYKESVKKSRENWKTKKGWKNCPSHTKAIINEKARIRRQNPKENIIHRIRKALRRSLNEKNLDKSSTTFDLLGYSKRDAVKHIEQFINQNCIICDNIKISLCNGEIDHIKPISLASSLEEIIELNQLYNLRLICIICNRKKGKHYDESTQCTGSSNQTSTPSQR